MNKLFLFFILLSIIPIAQGENISVISFIENGTFIISVNPNGNYIAGMQTDIEYDSNYSSLKNISEGELFSQNGSFQTFFNSGEITNSKIINIFSVILGMHNASLPGIFIATNITGNKCIKPNNIKIASPEGLLIPYDLITYNITSICKF